MKKLLYIAVLCLQVIILQAQDPSYPSPPAAAGNLVAGEYFIDTDPGIGGATAFSVSASVDIPGIPLTVNITGLSNGIHRIFWRVRNQEGSWSMTYFREFLYDADFTYTPAPAAPQNVVAAEYFIDTDPGIGSGTAISLSPGVDVSALPVTVNTASLTTGIHRLYVRTRNAEGKWSMSYFKDFLLDFDPAYPAIPSAPQNIVKAEYFIDTDPGFGSGTDIPLTPGIDIANLSVSVNTSSLSNGIHRVFIRTLNNEGKWSLVSLKDFAVEQDISYAPAPPAPQNIIAAEYFFDSDPGFGAATPISVTAGVDLNNLSFSANTNGLAIGTHRLFVRTLNAEGKWSLAYFSAFLVNNDFAYPTPPAAAQNIIAAEYFIDTDPGLGSATAITVNPSTDISNLNFTVNTTGLSNGKHTLYVRTRSQEGYWSITARDTFATSLVSVQPDSIQFGNVPIANAVSRNITISNASNAVQTVSSITAAAPFSTTFSGTINIPALQSITIPVTYNPSAAVTSSDSVRVQTSGGYYAVAVSGTGVPVTSSWTIEPAGGHNYGNVVLNATSGFDFTIRNTGNVPVVLSNVTLSNPAFVPVFIAGTSIAPNGTVSLRINFTPTTVTTYTAQLVIVSSTAGVSNVTTAVSGNGYSPGTPPTITFPGTNPYNGTSGVNPAVGQIGSYTYKMVYTSVNNKAPNSGFPKVGVDLNGDQDFDDLGEGVFTMAKEGTGVNYAAGVTYTYTFTHSNNNSTAGYRFFAEDSDGNTATGSQAAYVSGPVITDQQLDLRLFANDISFSKSNPIPGETFTLTAVIHNSTAVPAVNVPIKFYRDTILLDSGIIASVSAFGNATISKAFNFGADGFYPMKVYIDPDNTLGESSRLNNYAIRPIIVGTPLLPGGINATTSAVAQFCPTVSVTISGHADYFGSANPTAVAGAQVTINTGTQTILTTTNANGDYSFQIPSVACGGNLTYTISVTDFTFTSSTVTNSVPVPCPAIGACLPPRSNGGVQASVNTSRCASIVGSNATMNFTVKYRERDINNMWGLFDEIIKDTLKVFQDGVLTQVIPAADYTHAPGEEIIIPVTLPLTSTAPTTISAILTYTYIEYKQIPSSIYHGERTAITATGGGTITPEPAVPDLTVANFRQTSFVSFQIDEQNIKCVAAGSHKVSIFDSLPGSTPVLLKTVPISSLAPGTGITITHLDPSIAPGTHHIIVIADADGEVPEADETNNRMVFTMVVPKPDLTVTSIKPVNSQLNAGSATRFQATIKNTGKQSDSCSVQFLVNGVQLGGLIPVNFVKEKDSITILSDVFTVTNSDQTCGPIITVVADVNNDVDESNEGNNSRAVQLSADLASYQLSSEKGSVSNPAIVRVNTTGQFFPAIRNLGIRDVTNVKVSYRLSGSTLSGELIPVVRAGEQFASYGLFSHMFSTPGDYVVNVVADTANDICELSESNNIGSFHIRVVDSKMDLEVLSQYISPSSLNPNAGQNISIVGTVRNTGGKTSAPSVLRFLVDDIQLGNDIVINSIEPGKDTTVAASALYSSIIAGVKIMKIVADPLDVLDEEREDNNLATRAMIVGDAPDMAKASSNAIRFNPSGFIAGDSVLISYSIKNSGTQFGTAWVRFTVMDETGAITALDSVPFSLAANSSAIISKRMIISESKGRVIAQIVNCSPMEFDLLNNDDTLEYSTVRMLTGNATVNGDLDMKAANDQVFPGWIGGKLVLGDYDLIVNGKIINFDTAHFVITNGTGKLRFVNNLPANTYPVGTAIFRPNFVKINNAGVQDNFSIRVQPYVLQKGTFGDTVKSGNINVTWFIEEDIPGGSNASAEFLWSASDELPGFDRANSRTAHFVGNWALGAIGAAVADTNGQYSRSQSGFNSFSPFTVTSGLGSALPLRFITVNAVQSGQDVWVRWTTETEVNTSHFEIEFSTDGIRFVSVGHVSSRNQPGQQRYEFKHVSPQGMVLYYRIRQVDINQQFTYSKVVTLSLSASGTFVLYPNPATQFIQIKGMAATEVQSIRVFSSDGKVVGTYLSPSSLSIDVSRLKNGQYTLEIITKDRNRMLRTFIKL